MVRKPLLLGTSLLVLAIPAAAQSPAAPPDPAALTTITVTGYAELIDKADLSNDPAANAASVTVLRLPDEKKRNVRDYVELLKPIMGVAANNFDQGGIGFGFTMRGFSERSNGGGVAYSIDGVPVNLPGHALTNGYGDLTPLIPELIDTLVLTRGPFDVRFGANALGGSLQIVTQDQPTPGVALSGGNFDFGRAFVTQSAAIGAVSGYGSLVMSSTSGYRENAELRQLNTFNKIQFAMPGGAGSVRFQVFSDEFGAPGFLRRDRVESGALDPRTVINTTDGGNTDLQNLAFNYRQDGENPLKANAYVMHSTLDRFSNRTSTLPIDEGLPGQNQQVDDRTAFGGSVEKYFRWNRSDGAGADLFVGAGVRRDQVGSELYSTVRRVRGAQTENTHFTLTNPFGYAQADLKPWRWLKVTAGLRYDRLSFDINDRTRKLNVSPDIGIIQPKAGIVLSAFEGGSFFANYGRSFLPPSATGGQLSRNPDLDAPRLATREIGFQYRSPGGVWNVLADIYRTTFSNEIFNQPPPLLPTYLGPSRRDGFDVEVRARLYRDGARTVSAFANYSKVDGELVGRATGTSIPDVSEYFAKYGLDAAWPLFGGTRVMTLSLSQVWEGPRPLNATNTLRTKTFSRIDAKASFASANRSGISGYLGLVGYPDRRLEETAFTFGTPLQVGVSPKARVTLQAGVFVPF